MDSPASDIVDGHTAGSDQAGQCDAFPADDLDQTSPPVDEETGQPQKPSGPMQKRRRVTRACDECRRKKIKCDGKQPCTHCTVYSYECTYDQPSNRRRNAAPQYIEALESQLKRAKALLSIVCPNLDLNDPSIDAYLQSGILPPLPVGGPRTSQPSNEPRAGLRSEERPREDAHDSHLESMVKATGQLDLDEDGNWDYHGHSSGLSFMRRMQQQFGDIIAAPASSPFVKYRPLSQVFDSPTSTHQSPTESSSHLPAGTDLPLKQEARTLCDNALIDAGALLRVVHVPSFYTSMERIYDIAPENYGNAENTFLPLLYAVLALGTLFSKKDFDLDDGGYESAIDEGLKYFKASRQLMDIADCRDLTSLQAIVFMIQFLQSSAKLSTCYSYVGVALRSALRMGLHRSFNVNFSPIEAETRKRVFWIIRKMDTYVGAMLGLPHFLKDEDIDQEYPTEVDDEYITETEIRPMPEGRLSLIAASNAHTQIVQVLAKICQYVYPLKGTQSGGKNSVTYTVSYSKIREIEQDMQQWYDNLPVMLRPGSEAPNAIVRVQQLLRMAYGHSQLLLYRPFLHYVSESHKSEKIDQRAYACASACISVSRNIIHITAEMKRRGFLVGAYWFTMYTTFFAILSLLYFVLENPTNSTSHDLFQEALAGKAILAHFAKKSMAADRCTVTLNNIFEKLPDTVKHPPQPTESRKRRQENSPHPLQSRPISMIQESDFVAPGIRRASTFPESMPNNHRTAPNNPLPISQAHLATLGLEQTYARSPTQPSSEHFESLPSLTPTSTTTSSHGGFPLGSGHPALRKPPHSFPATPMPSAVVDPSGVDVPLSDVNAMMFPSADPFAYPNQPMTTFENTNFHHQGSPVIGGLPFQVSGIDRKTHPATFSPVPMGLKRLRRNDNDVQVYGPMPMYLMQGAQLTGAPDQLRFSHPNPQNIQMAGTEGGSMNLDDIFNGEDWANTFMDQGLGLSGGIGYSGTSGFGPNGPNMRGW